jgi:hypothetical protein
VIEDDGVGDSQACVAHHHDERPEFLGIVLIHLAAIRDKFKCIPNLAFFERLQSVLGRWFHTWRFDHVLVCCVGMLQPAKFFAVTQE